MQVTEEDPDANGGKLAKELNKRFGFKPLAAGLLDPKRFWFYMVLARDGEAVEVPLPETLGKDALKRSLDAAIRRLAPGFLKTVALYKPAEMGPPGAGGRYSHLTEALGQNVRVEDNDLIRKAGDSVEYRLGKMAGGQAYVLKSSLKPEYFKLANAAGQALADVAKRDELVQAAIPTTTPATPAKGAGK